MPAETCFLPYATRPATRLGTDKRLCASLSVCGYGSWLAFPEQLIPSEQAGHQCEAAQADKQNANREFKCHLVTLIFAVQGKKSTWQFPGQKDLERDEDLSGFTAREPFQGSLTSA